jgi:hypothetical protein
MSSLPGTTADQYLRDLIEHSDEPLTTALKSIDLKKENINTPEELLLYLFNNKEKFPTESVFSAIANLIESKNIPAGSTIPKNIFIWSNYLWILWILLVAGLLSLFLIIWKKKKKDKK